MGTLQKPLPKTSKGQSLEIGPLLPSNGGRTAPGAACWGPSNLAPLKKRGCEGSFCPRLYFQSPELHLLQSPSQTFFPSKYPWLPSFPLLPRFRFWYPGFLALPEFWFRKTFNRCLGLSSPLGARGAEDMGKCVPQCLRHLDIRKSVVGLATGAAAIYLLYKAIRAGIKCPPPLSTTSPICIARECPGPGERALPQEAPAPEASSLGGPKGDSSKFPFPSYFSFASSSKLP